MFLKEIIINMKRILALTCAILLLILSSCNATTPQDTSESITESAPQSTQANEEAKTESETSQALKNTITSMEKLKNVSGVISVTKQSFSQQINGAVAYKILYETENGRLSADAILPINYNSSTKQYPVLIYFPQINMTIEDLALKYALNGIILIRPFARGYDDSTGTRDLGGENDLTDSKKLLEIIDSARFIESSKIFVAGSSEGSINALRLFAEDTEKRISGCAVIDVIADLSAYSEFRGEVIENLFNSLIGKTYDEAPEEYNLRSAVKFTQKLDRPILIMHYLQSPITSVEQTDALYNLIKDTNQDCEYHKIDELSADFQGESLQKLLSFIDTLK